MSDDLVRRLREGVWGRARRADAVIHTAMHDGADYIEAQAARIAELKAALQSIVEYCDEPYLHYTDIMSKARAALAGGKK